MADVNALDLTPQRVVPTQTAGLFLFTPDLLSLQIEEAMGRAGYPGSQMIPAVQAVLRLVVGKLLGKRRINHIKPETVRFDADRTA